MSDFRPDRSMIDSGLYKTFDQPDEEPAVSLEPGTVLGGKYELLEQLGRGGMGVVWKAKDRIADRLVALKFVPNDLKRYEAEMQRVRESFGKVHALHHSSICPLYVLEDGGRYGYYLVMKYLEGETLDQFVLRKDPNRKGFSPGQVAALLSPAARALDYAHRNDVIHRDVKPSNIFLVKTPKGIEVQVIDFGLADEIRSSMSRVSQAEIDKAGTPLYMAPEQWKGHPLKAATDQYALAVAAYELLAGHLPFPGSNLELVRLAVLQDEPMPIREIPEHVNAALQKALAKNEADRFGSCTEFIKTFVPSERKAESAAVEVKPPPLPEPPVLDDRWFVADVTAAPPIIASPRPQQKPVFPIRTTTVCASVVAVFLLGLVWSQMTGYRKAVVTAVKVEQERQETALLAAEAKPTAEKAEPERKAGDRMELTINGVEYPFRWCPPGILMMGSPESEPERRTNETQHQVTLTRAFWMLETPVTQAMWESVTGSNPSHFKGVKLPVEQAAWIDCQEYILNLNRLGAAPSGYRFSLPTEAQWEYACRAGTTTPFHFGNVLNGDEANCDGEHPYGTNTKGPNLGKTTEVGTYPANAWGLYDMHGNVWEWCSDDYRSGTETDFVRLSSGSYRVIRGGGWLSHAKDCRSADRSGSEPSNRYNYIGVRLALVCAE